MGTLDLHVRSSVPMGALGRLGQRVEPGEAAPVSAQSTSKASDVDHKALPLNNSPNSCVRASVCMRVRAATRLDCSSSPNANEGGLVTLRLPGFFLA